MSWGTAVSSWWPLTLVVEREHLAWFLNHHLNPHTESTRYYYLLTMQLLTHRLGKTLAVQPLNEGQKTADSVEKVGSRFLDRKVSV